MRSLLLVLTFSLSGVLRPAWSQGELPFDTFEAFTDSLTVVATISDAAEREAALDALWDDLAAADQVPFRLGDEAAFLWHGAASTVEIAGDHNNWDPHDSALTRLGQSTVWMRTYTFPEAARIDYKFIVDGNWILDPVNPHQQWGGFGPNSELRMPAWVFPEETVRDPEVPVGTLSPNVKLASTNLGYGVSYRVWTPAGYASDNLRDLPVLYAVDGHEYSDDRLGAAQIVLDNLIADGRIEPTIAVFIDLRIGGQNRREDLYLQNPDFAAFVADELVPVIDAEYRTQPDRDSRVILGTSFGGVFSAYLGVMHPETFGKLAIQSPAFWASENPGWWDGPSIYEMMADAEESLFEVYMSSGTVEGIVGDARKMRDVLEANNHALTYREVPEGHSWGNWRALIDEALIALLPSSTTSAEDGAVPGHSLSLAAYPNPTTSRVAFTFSLDAPARVGITCYDVLGRRSHTVIGDTLAAPGPHTITSEALEAAGAYLCHLTAGAQTATQTVTVVR